MTADEDGDGDGDGDGGLYLPVIVIDLTREYRTGQVDNPSMPPTEVVSLTTCAFCKHAEGRVMANHMCVCVVLLHQSRVEWSKTSIE